MKWFNAPDDVITKLALDVMKLNEGETDNFYTVQLPTFVDVELPQDAKPIKDIENDIRDDFKFKDELVSSCRSIIENVDNPIALHIRRGDFITNSQNHPPLPLDYYKRALKLFGDDRQVIIFSDDTKWCKEQEIFSDDRFLVSEDNDQSYDLCLMSMCNDFIIANSSFSWWGAWLGNRGKVVAPKQWFGKGLNHNTKDLYCSDWSVL